MAHRLLTVSMIRIALIAVSIFSSALAPGQDAELLFEEKTLKLEDATQGETVEIEFPFSNAGEAPLIIEDIKVGCHCTTFDYPKEPIMPGDTGMVTVFFNTTTVWDYQDRTLEVYSNSKKSPIKIRFKVFVQGEDLSR